MALDYHVNNGRGEQNTLIYDSAVTNTKKIYSYKELGDEVAKCAGMIKNAGAQKGDRIIIYIPMIAHTMIAML